VSGSALSGFGGQQPPAPGATVAEVIGWMARVAPERVALQTAGGSVSYRELDEQAGRLAGALHEELGDGRDPLEPRVIIWIGGPLAAAVASLAVLRAGLIPVSVDPTAPPERVARIVAQVGAAIVLTDVGPGAEVGAPTVDPLVRAGQAPSADVHCPPASLASLVFTSGTTGEPKGIMLPAAARPVLDDSGLRALTVTEEGSELEREQYAASQEAPMRVGFLWAGTVGNAEGQLQRLMMTTGTVVFFDLRREGVSRLGAWLTRERVISCLTPPPTVLRSLLGVLEPGQVFADLRVVALTGEAIDWSDLARLRAHLVDEAVILLAYGLSETGMITSLLVAATTAAPEGPLGAGWPAPGREVSIRDPDGEEVASGEVGEVTVTGADIAIGYWNDPAATAAAFATLPDGRRRMRTGDRGRLREDGSLELLGRLDHMVKIAGNRVELGDIEAVLRAQEGVAQAAATTYVDHTSALRLIAFAAPAPGVELDGGRLRAALAELLPTASLPDRVQILDAIPQLAAGKIDRRSLPAPAPPTVALDPDQRPVTPVQRELADIWCEVLEVEQVGLDDDFFALGGDSLRAAWLFAEIETRLGLDRPVSLLLAVPQLGALAGALQDDATWSGLVAIQPAGAGMPLFVVHDQFGNLFPIRQIVSGLDADQPIFGIQADALSGELADETLHEVAARYVQQVRALAPHGPYQLYGSMIGGLIAFEMALQIEALGETVAFLGVADLSGPVSPPPPAWRRLRHRVGTAVRSGGAPGPSPGPDIEAAAAPGAALEAAPATEAGLLAVRRAQAAHDHYVRLAAVYQPQRRLAASMTVVAGGAAAGDGSGWRRHVDGQVAVVGLGEVRSTVALKADGSGLR
jgi:acyl-coenzyme A synthetase/AMP-(fatty) acid ligase/thioesterase domain-containing protein/acyl carrier protein